MYLVLAWGFVGFTAVMVTAAIWVSLTNRVHPPD
jgi:hypothetical protein